MIITKITAIYWVVLLHAIRLFACLCHLHRQCFYQVGTIISTLQMKPRPEEDDELVRVETPIEG